MTRLDDIAARYGAKTTQGLWDLLDHAAVAAEIVRRHDAADDDDQVLDLAAEAVLIHVGEAVHRMSAEFVADNPDLGLADALAMRHVIAHGYDIVDYTQVWETLRTDIPRLVRGVGPLIVG